MVLNVCNEMAIPEAAATLRTYINRPSRELKENWEVDLAALLQEYFQYLFKELERSDNVRNAANFAEAALVIQASSEIYCKKVDYLWEFMVKFLHRLQDETTDEPKDKQKCGRRRVDELEKSRLFEEVLRKVVVPDIKNGMAEKVKLLVDHFHLLVKLREKQLYGEVEDEEGNNIDYDEIGEPDREEPLRKNLTNKELLKKPLFPPSFWIDAFQIIEAGLRKLLHLGPEDPIDHAAVDAECERHKENRQNEAEAPHNEESAPDAQGSEANPPDAQRSEENGKAANDEDIGYITGNDEIASLPGNVVALPAGTFDEAGTSTTVDADLGVLTPAENTLVGSPVSPPPEPPPFPYDHTFDFPEQAALTPLPSTLENDDQEVLAGSRSARRRDKIVTVSSPWVEFPDERLYQEKIFRKRKSTELTADQIATIESLKGRIVIKPRIAPEYLKKDLFLAQHGITIEENDNSVPTENRVSVVYLLDVKHKKRLIQELEKRLVFEENLEVLRKKYSQDLEEDFRGFEDTEPSDGETYGFRGFPSPPCVSNILATLAEEEEEDFRGFPDENVSVTQQQEPKDASPPQLESNVNPPGRPEKDDNAPVILTEASATRFRNLVHKAIKWQEFIAPKLTTAWERGHFEIHEYESEILDAFPQNSSTRTLTFAEVVADKPTEDIPRYFLATLQLANSCSIGISTTVDDPLAMDSMGMTLLPPARQQEPMAGCFASTSTSEVSQGIRNPFAAVSLPFTVYEAHSSQQYQMQEDTEKPFRKRKCNQSNCKESTSEEEDDDTDESEEDEWWLEPKKVARKRKLNKR